MVEVSSSSSSSSLHGSITTIVAQLAATPLSLAQDLAAAGRATEGTAAFLVLEAAKPWSRQTHKYFPELARARAADLMRVAQAIKIGKAGYEVDGVRVDFAHPVSVADVFEAFVIPQDIASEMWR